MVVTDYVAVPSAHYQLYNFMQNSTLGGVVQYMPIKHSNVMGMSLHLMSVLWSSLVFAIM